MQIIIYGAGAIGGVVGGHLARVGNDVVLIGRPDHVKAIQEHGLRLLTPTGTHVLKVPAVTAPGDIQFQPDSVVFLCVKGQNTEEALRDLKAAAKDAPIFCFQNGVRNEEATAQHFSRVYGVRVIVRAAYLTDGEVIARHDPPGWLIMGCYPEGTDDLVEDMAARLRAAGFFVKVTPDIMPYKWSQLLGNLANAINAITSGGEEEIGDIVRAAHQEGQEILAQSGIRWISAEKLASEWPESTLKPRAALDYAAQSSSWQSLTRRQGTIETNFFNGEIVQLAKKLGRRAPINEETLRISKEMAANREPPGRYTPAQLKAVLGLD